MVLQAGSVTDHNVHGVSGFRLTKRRKQITMCRRHPLMYLSQL